MPKQNLLSFLIFFEVKVGRGGLTDWCLRDKATDFLIKRISLSASW